MFILPSSPDENHEACRPRTAAGKRRRTLLFLVTTALFAALLCVCAPFSVPIGPVPITLATFAVFLCAGLLPPGQATLSVGLYLAIGAVGLPVFSAFRGGIAHLVGPTGGFLWGYIPAALCASLLIALGKRKKPFYPIGMLAGNLLLYLFGGVWYSVSAGVTFLQAMSVCALPFLPGDALKIALASTLCILLRTPLDRVLGRHASLGGPSAEEAETGKAGENPDKKDEN
jgi:biotin transport system substrate-specific component